MVRTCTLLKRGFFLKIGIFSFPPEKSYFSADTGPNNLIFCVNIPQGLFETLLGPESVFSAFLALIRLAEKPNFSAFFDFKSYIDFDAK